MQIAPLAHGQALGHLHPGGPLVRPAGSPEQWRVATALRNLAIAHTDAPRYLLAHEVGAVLAMLPDLQRRFLVATLWNTGARINEALALTPADFELDGQRPFVALRTLKQRRRGKGRPRAGEAVKRLVPLLDPQYAQLAREYLSTFKLARGAQIWPVTDQTVRNWLKEAEGGLRGRGVNLVVALTPHVFRHSFAMHHLLQGNTHIKRLQAYLGHRSLRSTECYTQILALDAAASEIGLSFTVIGSDNPLLQTLLRA
ncbi:resolvase [Aeromonas caviae]|uniref:Resolvase n=5 Tax=Aeromonas caviae TaxID=648 RepID=A0ABD0B8M6_AERCA|nr:tyrosine-type recombinase/integrase [Aeromonas caviae]BCR31435.1 resolvase [Aeromonas caviae]GJA71901.1 resolvase [Aeromonas caviae]GJA81630.1 resolvase [Aeromonas caviae]GJB00122.1 resolvase [Aeromonas caviae]GJB11408.1 resolvase [Aeromonas caviae]